MAQKRWQRLLQQALETEDYEINCMECFEALDQYAELILTGVDPDDILPTVNQHLEHCSCCTEEFKALMVILQESAKNETSPAS
jgi:hypothetical protein